MNGPPKIESLGKFYPSLRISQNFLMGLGVSDFVSVIHICAFLLSHYTFSSRARILRCQSWHLGKSRILPFATPHVASIGNSLELTLKELIRSFAILLKINWSFITIFRTNLGKGRAWIRLALMQKKLADYVREMTEHRSDIL